MDKFLPYALIATGIAMLWIAGSAVVAGGPPLMVAMGVLLGAVGAISVTTGTIYVVVE